MSCYYIDTCALKWRYLSGSPTSIINRIMDDRGNKVFTSELTVLEWSSALGSACRDSKIDYQGFKSNELALMTDIADGKLAIFPMPRSIEKARYLIEYIGVFQKRALKTGDSIQLVTALDVATNARESVIFVTCDETLAHIIEDIDTFQPFLKAWFIAP